MSLILSAVCVGWLANYNHLALFYLKSVVFLEFFCNFANLVDRSPLIVFATKEVIVLDEG